MKIRPEEIEKAKLMNPIKETIEGYGIKINREGFCSCCFHENDHTASMKIYANGTFHCFGCGASGDVIKFTQMINNCTFYQALKILGVDVDKPLSWTEERRLKREQTERKIYKDKTDFIKKCVDRLDNEINAKSRQIRLLCMADGELNPFDEAEAVEAENERMRLLVRKSNAEELLKEIEGDYNARHNHT